MTRKPIPAGARDLPEVLALVHSAYRGESSRAGWTTEADLIDGARTDLDLLAADLADPRTTILLVRDEQGALACAAVTDRGSGVGYFGMFAVRPRAQGVGVGSALLAAAQEHARGFGAVRLEMSVLWVRTDLLAWYARRGYTPTGERRAFPYGDERFGHPRRDDLELLVLARDL